MTPAERATCADEADEHVDLSCRLLPDLRSGVPLMRERVAPERLTQLRGRLSFSGLVNERPEERKAREFVQEFRGRCMLVRWSSDEQRDELVEDREHDLVIARRTAACDRLVAEIQSQRRLGCAYLIAPIGILRSRRFVPATSVAPVLPNDHREVGIPGHCVHRLRARR